MQEEALRYAEAFLVAHGKDRSANPGMPFRTRSSHIRRVCLWLERLLAQEGEAIENKEALRLAAALHDVGYGEGAENHAAHGAEILLRYAAERGIDAGIASRAAFLVREHSAKEKWLHAADAPLDLILLMEADLLDEEGAMGLALDCMSAGALGLDFEGAFARMEKFEPPRLAKNPMVTQTAKRYWREKQRLIRAFLRAFAFDLGKDGRTEDDGNHEAD